MRWMWVLAATGCVADDGDLFSQLTSLTGGAPEPTSFDDLVLQSDSRVLLQAPFSSHSWDYALVSSDPDVVAAAPLEEGAVLWDGVNDGSTVPLAGDQALVTFEEDGEPWLAVELATGTPGIAELSWVDAATGEILDTREVEVAEPARAAVAFVNTEGWSMLPPPTAGLRLLEGDALVLDLVPFDDRGRPLTGFDPRPDSEVKFSLSGRTSVFARAGAPPPQVPVGTWEWVAPQDVIALELRSGYDRDNDTALLVVGIDREGHDVYGIPATFTDSNGATGDVYAYEDAPGAPEREVVASWGDLDATASIRTWGPGKVETVDTFGAGCNTSRLGAVPLAGLLAVAAIGRRRARRR